MSTNKLESKATKKPAIKRVDIFQIPGLPDERAGRGVWLPVVNADGRWLWGGGVSHGGTEFTEVGLSNAGGFSQGTLGRFVSVRAFGSLLRLGRWL